MKIRVDSNIFSSKKQALSFFEEAIMGTDGSEQERMVFAYMAIKDGCTNINTYKEQAV